MCFVSSMALAALRYGSFDTWRLLSKVVDSASLAPASCLAAAAASRNMRVWNLVRERFPDDWQKRECLLASLYASVTHDNVGLMAELLYELGELETAERDQLLVATAGNGSYVCWMFLHRTLRWTVSADMMDELADAAVLGKQEDILLRLAMSPDMSDRQRVRLCWKMRLDRAVANKNLTDIQDVLMAARCLKPEDLSAAQNLFLKKGMKLVKERLIDPAVDRAIGEWCRYNATSSRRVELKPVISTTYQVVERKDDEARKAA